MSTLVSSQRIASQPAPARHRIAMPHAPRALVTFLLAASVAALAVVADQLISTWADGHLLAAWMLMWAVVFAGSLLLTHPARRLAQQVMRVLNGWAERRAQARAEARFMALARHDERLLADLKLVRDHNEAMQAERLALSEALSPLGQALTASNERSEWEAGPLESVSMGHGRRYALYYI